MLYRDVVCAGCNQIECPVAGHPCIVGITADDLIDAIEQRLSGGRSEPVLPSGTRVKDWDVVASAAALALKADSVAAV
jgi:hypothetical protein